MYARCIFETVRMASATLEIVLRVIVHSLRTDSGCGLHTDMTDNRRVSLQNRCEKDVATLAHL